MAPSIKLDVTINPPLHLHFSPDALALVAIVLVNKNQTETKIFCKTDLVNESEPEEGEEEEDDSHMLVEVGSEEGHMGKVLGIAACPASQNPNYNPGMPPSQRVVTCGADGTCIVWDVSVSNRTKTVLSGHRDVRQVFFSERHDVAITTGAEGGIIFWDMGSRSALTMVLAGGSKKKQAGAPEEDAEGREKREAIAREEREKSVRQRQLDWVGVGSTARRALRPLVAMSPSEIFLATAEVSNRLGVFIVRDMKSTSELFRGSLGEDRVTAMTWITDRDLVIGSANGFVTHWHVKFDGAQFLRVAAIDDETFDPNVNQADEYMNSMLMTNRKGPSAGQGLGLGLGAGGGAGAGTGAGYSRAGAAAAAAASIAAEAAKAGFSLADTGVTVLDCTPRTALEHRHQAPVFALHALDPEGSLVLSSSLDKTLRVWSLALGEGASQVAGEMVCKEAIIVDSRTMLPLIFVDIEDNIVVAATESGALIWWNVPPAPLARIEVVTRHAGLVTAGCFARICGNTKVLLTASEDMTVAVTRVSDRAALPSFERGHKSPIVALAVNESGTLLATGSMTGTVRIWGMDPAKHSYLASIAAPGSSAPRPLAPAGGAGAAAEVHCRTPLRTLKGHGKDPIRCLAWKPGSLRDGSHILISACKDGTARVWDYNQKDLDKDLNDLKKVWILMCMLKEIYIH